METASVGSRDLDSGDFADTNRVDCLRHIHHLFVDPSEEAPLTKDPLRTASHVRIWHLVWAVKGVARPLPSRSSIEAETPARHQAGFIQVALGPTLGASMSPEELGQGTLVKLSFRNG